MACEIVISPPGMEPIYPALGVQSLNQWTSRGVPTGLLNISLQDLSGRRFGERPSKEPPCSFFRIQFSSFFFQMLPLLQLPSLPSPESQSDLEPPMSAPQSYRHTYLSDLNTCFPGPKLFSLWVGRHVNSRPFHFNV